MWMCDSFFFKLIELALQERCVKIIILMPYVEHSFVSFTNYHENSNYHHAEIAHHLNSEH